MNGWRLKQEASKVDGLRQELTSLRDALTQVEKENSGYKTRIDLLQETVSKLEESGNKLSCSFEESIESLKEENNGLRNAIGHLWKELYGYDDFSKAVISNEPE